MPNLRTWVESNGDYSPSNDLWSVLSTCYSEMIKYCSKSLRYLELTLPRDITAASNAYREYEDRARSLIKQANNLEAFQLWDNVNSHTYMTFQEAINGKQNLRALSSFSFKLFDETPSLETPSILTKLTHITKFGNFTSGLNMLKLYGNRLNLLKIVGPVPYCAVKLIDCALYCPKITELIMDERHLRLFLKEGKSSLFQFVTKLGLGMKGQSKWFEKEIQTELDALSGTTFFPKLRLIRILDHIFSDKLNSNPELKGFVLLWSHKLMEERGISVRDWENQPFYDIP